MERGIFGSTISLGGLLNDTFFSDGETDQFLRELEQGVPKDMLTGPPCGEADSGATSFDSTFSGNGTSWLPYSGPLGDVNFRPIPGPLARIRLLCNFHSSFYSQTHLDLKSSTGVCTRTGALSMAVGSGTMTTGYKDSSGGTSISP